MMLPFKVYSTALYSEQIQGRPMPAAAARGARQAAALAGELVALHGGVAVVLGPGTYRDVVTAPAMGDSLHLTT